MSEPPIDWPANGLIPAVIQDDTTDAVLMTGFMNAEALAATRTTGEVHFWSRSRQELWHKGASSGHVQHVRRIAINCELNSLLIRVEQVGAVCHEGYATCYYREILPDGSLQRTQDRLFDPRDVYGDGNGLAGITAEWWGAYAYLRDSDLSTESGTSRMLHALGGSVRGRIQDELRELAGVLTGTHMHSSQHEDALLESSQCAYWIVSECLLRGIRYDEVRPDRALDVIDATVDPATAAVILRAEAEVLGDLSPATAAHLLHMIAEAVQTLGIDPRDIIHRDLDELRTKPYLTPYFAR